MAVSPVAARESRGTDAWPTVYNAVAGERHSQPTKDGHWFMSRLIRYVPNAARKVLIVQNPTAGSRSGAALVEALTRRLAACGFDVESIHDLARLGSAVGDPGASGVRAVVAAGGDGTVSAAVNRTPPDTPLAVLPLGTENLVARYLEHSADPLSLSRRIAHGATVALDAGRAGDRLFLLMAGCGFDADVVRRLHVHRRGHIRHLSYVKPIVDSIRSYKYPALRVSWEPAATGEPPSPIGRDERGRAERGRDERGREERGRDERGRDERGRDERGRESLTARWLFVVNIPKYALDLKIAPGAAPTDGLLDVCALEYGTFWGGIRYLVGILRGKHLGWSDCAMLRTRRLSVESADGVPYQLDGDPGGLLPVEIVAVPGRVRMVVAESWAIRQGYRHRGP
jgi:diacylglycerol kinase family enzyme